MNKPRVGVSVVSTRQRWALFGLFVAVVAVALVLVFAERGSSPEPIKADSVLGTAGSADLVVRFPWHASSWCAGDFTVRVTESDTEVAVANVLEKKVSSTTCGSISTVDDHAALDVTLGSDLGKRKVVRIPDGAVLPVSAP
jgi:hypothetical protein